MAKSKSIFICNNCGAQSPQWIGQCPECLEWNTIEEDISFVSKNNTQKRSKSIRTSKMSEVSKKELKRLSTGISEFDRVLGGGLVKGQVILLGGEPGIGKSTLLTQLSKSLLKSEILYVCGEESTHQIKLRTERMAYSGENLNMLPETDANNIVLGMESTQGVSLVIVDSIQTLHSEDFSGIAGSVSQVKGCSQIITDAAKRLGVPVILVGHVTKQGTVAGPKLLEHIVDTVLYLEGDSQHLFRLLRTTKNRFGPVSEVGVFEMVEEGMREIKNPSDVFLQDTEDGVSGSAITVVMEGFRPILFEVQALTVNTTFGYPRRTTTGYNANRLQVLLAIVEKRGGLNVGNNDVYLSVAGGFKITEYSADLAACLAIASSLKNKPIKPKTAIFGECGLGGEVRRVPHIDKRIKEAKKLGYTNIISPSNVKTLKQALSKAF